MEMQIKNNVFRILLVPLLFISCNQMENDKNIIDSPLAIVVKFESAQSFRDYETAKQFFNLESVYGKLAEKSNINVEEMWKQFVEFNYSMGNSSSKFTNCFPYHNYKIVVTENEKSSTIQLISKNIDSPIKEIKYTLNLIDNNKWIITQIDYLKSK